MFVLFFSSFNIFFFPFFVNSLICWKNFSESYFFYLQYKLYKNMYKTRIITKKKLVNLSFTCRCRQQKIVYASF